MSMVEDVIHNPVYLLFALIVLAVVIVIIAALAAPSSDIGQLLFGYFKTLFR